MVRLERKLDHQQADPPARSGHPRCRPWLTSAGWSRGAAISRVVGDLRQSSSPERLICTVREEVVLVDYEDFEDAQTRIGHFIDGIYRMKRMRSALGYCRAS